MTKAYFVQHTHWDREWYFTKEDAIVLSDQVFTEALEELERNKDANFCLDGQSSILDEYLEIHPEKLSLIKELINENRLFVGPWYSQTDGLLVDAESILRNLTIGVHDIKIKYGEPMMLGYLPDTFGFNSQLPTILNHAGIDTFMAWRGINFDKISPSPYFKWKGLGDKSVNAIYFPFGYMTGLMTLDSINNKKDFVENKLDPSINFLSEKGNNEEVLIPSGIDQKSMLHNINSIVDELNRFSENEIKISNYEEFADIIRKRTDLPAYRGELREPVYARVHRSISSSRTGLKIENFNLEQTIIREIEPMMVMSEKLGIKIGKGLLHRLWKLVLQNQAHDSIGGCVSDDVAIDIYQRIKEAKEIAEGIKNLILKRLADNIELNDNEVIVLNTDLYDFDGLKKIHIVTNSKNIEFESGVKAEILSEKYYPPRENVQRLISTGFDFITEPPYFELDVLIDVKIPALGYKVIKFKESKNELNAAKENNKKYIEKNNLKIIFEDSRINLYFEDNLIIENLFTLTDQGNDGDTYDFSPLPQEKEKILTFDSAFNKKGSITDQLVVEGKDYLPYDLDDRINNTENKVEVRYKLYISILHDGTIETKLEFDNNTLSHRLRLRINVLSEDGKSIAQIQNGFNYNSTKVIPEEWQKKYVEKPENIEIFDKSVSVLHDGYIFTTYFDAIKEYERKNNYLYFTLFATTGQLGKPDLEWRPGRASGDTTNEGHIMMPTPLAQETGKVYRRFAFKLDEGTFDENKIYKKSLERLSPSISYQSQKLNKFIYRLDNKIWPLQSDKKKLPKEYEGINLSKDYIISAIYPSYFNSAGYVIRLANPTKKTINLDKQLIDDSKFINALEERVDSAKIIEPYDYISLYIK
ncbi:glycoside hydrolase family 38 N-terminal domain-containing protein [Helcococcus kunzii]